MCWTEFYVYTCIFLKLNFDKISGTVLEIHFSVYSWQNISMPIYIFI